MGEGGVTFEEWWPKTDMGASFNQIEFGRRAWNAALEEAKKAAYGCMPPDVDSIHPFHSGGMEYGVNLAIESIEKLKA